MGREQFFPPSLLPARALYEVHLAVSHPSVWSSKIDEAQGLTPCPQVAHSTWTASFYSGWKKSKHPLGETTGIESFVIQRRFTAAPGMCGFTLYLFVFVCVYVWSRVWGVCVCEHVERPERASSSLLLTLCSKSWGKNLMPWSQSSDLSKSQRSSSLHPCEADVTGVFIPVKLVLQVCSRIPGWCLCAGVQTPVLLDAGQALLCHILSSSPYPLFPKFPQRFCFLFVCVYAHVYICGFCLCMCVYAHMCICGTFFVYLYVCMLTCVFMRLCLLHGAGVWTAVLMTKQQVLITGSSSRHHLDHL